MPFFIVRSQWTGEVRPPHPRFLAVEARGYGSLAEAEAVEVLARSFNPDLTCRIVKARHPRQALLAALALETGAEEASRAGP